MADEAVDHQGTDVALRAVSPTDSKFDDISTNVSSFWTFVRSSPLVQHRPLRKFIRLQPTLRPAQAVTAYP